MLPLTRTACPKLDAMDRLTDIRQREYYAGAIMIFQESGGATNVEC